MPLDQDKLQNLLAQKTSSKKIVEFFKGASEANRKKLSGFCIKNLKACLKDDRQAWLNSDFSGSDLLIPATFAAYCTSTPSQFDLGWRTHVAGDLVYELLADRKPDWIEDWVERCCAQLNVLNFEDIRRLNKAGLCPVPTNDNFGRMMITSIDRSNKNPLAGLKRDPELLDEVIWRIFEVPYVMDLEMMIGYLSNDWADALVELSKQGLLDRQQLFERCFSAPNMGFNREQVKVFLYLHDALKPSLDERVGMLESYAALLESNIPTVVKWAFETLQTLDKDQAQDEQRLAEILRAALRSPTKSMIKAALKWLALLIKRTETCTESACLAATEGLLHEKPDVQTEAWKFIEKQASSTQAVVDELARLAPTTSASVRKQITKWLKENSAAEPTSGTSMDAEESAATSESLNEAVALAKKCNKNLAALLGIPELLKAIKNQKLTIPPCSFDGTELARLWNREELKPIQSLEELVEVAALVLEDGSLVEDAERVLEALTCFPVAGDAAALKIADPIIKRAKKRSIRCAAFCGAGADHDIVPVIEAWSGNRDRLEDLLELNQDDRGAERGQGLTGFLGERSRAVMNRFIDKQPLSLLATPTHAGSWIDPLVLGKRLKKIKHEKDLLDFDQVLALLRMAPDNRTKALKAAQEIPGEFAAAFRYACGEETKKIGKTYYLWVAAARARSPFEDDSLVEKKFPDLGVDAGLVGHYFVRDSGKKKKHAWDVTTLTYTDDSPKPKFDHKGWQTRSNADPLLPTTAIHEDPEHSAAHIDHEPCKPHTFDLAASVWPLARDTYFLPTANVKPLFDVNTPLRELSTWGVIRALSDHWPFHRAMGVDLSIAAIEDGRWDPSKAGRMIAVEIYFANRFTKTLTEIAAVSHLHAFQIAHSLIAMLAHRPLNRPSSFAGLLELLYELLEEVQIKLEDATAREYLESIKGSSKAAKCAKRILSFEPDSPPDFNTIYQQALQGRLSANRRLVKR
jgi:hypothetical protein